MSNDLVLGIDLGTHGARALCVDRQGQIHAHGGSSYARTLGPEGIQEQSLDKMWAGFLEAVQDCLERIPDRSRIEAIGVTHQRGTLVSWDSQGQVLGRAICDSDTRSWPQARFLEKEIGSVRLFRDTGCPPLPFVGLSKILWLKETQPDLFKEVARFGSIQDWAVQCLTGEFHSSPGSAQRLGIVDIQQPLAYAVDLLSDLDLDQNLFIPLQQLNSVLGGLTQEVAGVLGLAEGLPVVAVPGDQPAGFLGSGGALEGSAGINLGTSFLISYPVPDRHGLLQRERSGSSTLEILPDGESALEWGSGAGTNVLDWMRETLFELESVEELNQLLDTSPDLSQNIVILPFWWPALSDQQGSIIGLRSAHSRGDLVRAVYRSLAYGIREAWEVLSRETGIIPAKAALFGGASRNDYLCQLLADVLERPLYRSGTSEASAFGAAVCAAVGGGWYETSDQGAQEMCQVVRSFQPQLDYQQGYQEYTRVRDQYSWMKSL